MGLGLGLPLVISSLTAMLAPNFVVLVVARSLFGFGIGRFRAISVGLGARLVLQEHVGRTTSLIFAGVSLGMLIGGPAGALIGDLAGVPRLASARAVRCGAAGTVGFVAFAAIVPAVHAMPK
ncbi:hypothetical protein [Paraburkholderia silvatlantica]|uniref:hypothetical protein n=1 Tax=Paraburkholderia silvatlantica TaxID=321895 RepID=UPI0037503E82